MNFQFKAMLLDSGPLHPRKDLCMKKIMKIPSDSHITRGGISFRFVTNPDMERVKILKISEKGLPVLHRCVNTVGTCQ